MAIFKYELSKDADEKAVEVKPLVMGKATFKIKNAFTKDKDGKAYLDNDGNPKLKLQLDVRDVSGNVGALYDTFTAKTSWKIPQLLESVGMPHLNDGHLNTEQVIGCTGKCELKEHATYGVQIKYLKPSAKMPAKPIKTDYSDELEQDEIPF